MESALGGPARTRVILILAAVLAMSSADAATVGAAAAPLRNSLHIDNTDIGLLVTVSSLVAAVAAVPFGVLADRMRRNLIMAVSVTFWGVAMIASAFAGDFGDLLVTRLILGIVTASAGPVVASMVGDYFASGERGRIYSYILTGELAGAGVGFAITGDIAALSWRAAFVILALPTFYLAWLLYRLPEPTRGGMAPLLPEQPAGQRSSHHTPPPAATWNQAPTTEDQAAARGWSSVLPTGVDETWVTPPTDPASVTPGGRRPLGQPQGEYQTMRTATAGWELDTDDNPAETDAQRVARQKGVKADEDKILMRSPSSMGLKDAIRYMLRIRTNVILIVASACCYFYLTGIQTFGSEFAHEQYGVSTALANALILVVGIGAVIGVLLGGWASDRLLKRGVLNSRLLVSGIAAVICTAAFLPALLSRSVVTAVPYLAIAGMMLMAQNPPIDAARLDIMPAGLWGRAEGFRTLLRTAAQSLAPVLFGAMAGWLGGHREGMELTFLILLIPLLANGVILLWGLKSYPTDVATAAATPGDAPTSARRRRRRNWWPS